MKKKVVLAYSGGLDTSFCIKYLTSEKDCEVHAVTINTGGFDDAEMKSIGEKALALGATSFKSIDARESFYQNCLRYLVYGNVLRGNVYPLSVSAERVFQALEILNFAKSIDAHAVAHGSTGAGNDQVRFDIIFQILGNHIEVITPIRELRLSRQEEVTYLQQHGIALNWEKAQYSINKGLWGTSVGGKETLTSDTSLPESAYPSQLKRNDSEKLTLHFTHGELSGIEGYEITNKVELIAKLAEISSAFAIGRDTHVGDTIIGIKGRVGFEAPAALIIIKAHQLLEKHTLSKWQTYWKDQLANWYGMFLHEAQYLDPSMRDIESFLEHSQANVTGAVHISLHPYRFELNGVDSDFDLMRSDFGVYGEMNNAWSGDDVKGFTKILGNATHIFQNVQAKNQKI